MGRIYRTNRGTPIDIEAIRLQNQKEIAAGNVNMNARGDLLGKGGKIIKKASDISKKQFTESPRSGSKLTSLKSDIDEDIKQEPKKYIEAEKPKKKKESPPKDKKEVILPNGDIIVVDKDQDPDGEITND